MSFDSPLPQRILPGFCQIEAAVAVMAAASIEARGAVFTRREVVDFILDLAGYTAGQADEMRKIIGKKQKELIPAERAKFVEGCVRNGIERALAVRIWQFIEPFAGYGFNKAHSVCYGLLAYRTAWLKANQPLAFMAALLSSVKNNADKVAEYLAECAALRLRILPPDVNESGAECEIEPGGERVRIGLGYVRSVREHEVRELVAAREAGGRFRSLSDLAARAGAGAPSLELLAWSGACDSLVEGREGRRIALWQLGVATPGKTVPGGTQLALPLDLPAPPNLCRLSAWERMLADYRTSGLTTAPYPTALLR